MNNPLRIAVLTNDKNELPAWEFEMLRQLMKTDYAKIVVFIRGQQKLKIKTSFFYKLFRKFENWWFHSLPDAYEKKNIVNEFGSIPLADTSDPEALRKYDLDVIYTSHKCIADDAILSVSNFGIWAVEFGIDQYRNAEPPGFWEVIKNEETTGASLKIKRPGSHEFVSAYRGVTTTVPYSVKNNLNSIAWKASSFFHYRLRELFLNGSQSFFEKHNSNRDPSYNSDAPLTFPGNFLMTWIFIRNVFRYFKQKMWSKLSQKKFTLLYSTQKFSIDDFDLNSFRSLSLPGKSFWADPFVIEKEGMQYIFFEEFSAEKNRAHINVLEAHQDGSFSQPKCVLEKDYHLSYPFVFEWEGSFYMVPETSSNRTVELYKAKNFPFEWEFVIDLMEDVLIIDATLLFEKGKWWLFGCTYHHSATSTNDQLLLYYSDNLFSKTWKAHPQNPIATDVSNCRPAGKIFRMNNELFRPAQNNASQQYGYGLVINKIELMNETEYREKKIVETLPSNENKLSAIHHLSFSNDLIVIDGIRKTKD